MPSSPPGGLPPVTAILCLLAAIWLLALGLSIFAAMAKSCLPPRGHSDAVTFEFPLAAFDCRVLSRRAGFRLGTSC
jgi:hypothetical protein